MSEPYLIAHLVRGEPAFDIAIQMPMGEEIWWIIPTSGHRARPYWSARLIDIDDTYELDFYRTSFQLDGPPSVPENWPDHYPASSARSSSKITSAEDLLKELGL